MTVKSSQPRAQVATAGGLDAGRHVLASGERMKVVVAALRPGEEIAPHAADVNLVLAVLDGDGRMLVGDEVREVRAGDFALVPAGLPRGLQAGAAGMRALHVASPPPAPGDHPHSRGSWPSWPEAGARAGEAVREEHAGLRPTVDGLGALADSLPALDPEERGRRLDEVLAFLRDDLLTHAATEEEALYPAAERVLRARGGAVRTMTLGHETIAGLVDDLEQATADDDAARLPGILHSLRAIVLLHLAEEEQVYLPALAGLSAEEGAALAARLGLDTHAGSGHHHGSRDV